ncbi:Piso0_000666 [Millerozyma farinosa CBS 7064]|uniref:Piso0_000666 protein n=1 Tax=Pichia sorbitophila (strain ATCC MYA-4447 / BCRC 22081 / CBS 7064 / NBRC 10061 / NRRL Y-12695) TaxID=559304 RepID=G8YPQ5_PICSO|nr:Piso0_000666 [Millerozyma farinosa CBS 7064]
MADEQGERELLFAGSGSLKPNSYTKDLVIITEDQPEGEEEWNIEQRAINKQLNWWVRPTVSKVVILLFIFAFCETLSGASETTIMLTQACNSVKKRSHTDKCNEVDSQMIMSSFYMMSQILSGIFIFVTSGKAGGLSDRFGRKSIICTVILTSVIGRSLNYVILKNSDTFRMYLVLMASCIYTIAGGFMVLRVVSDCYVTDVCEPHMRVIWFGIIRATTYGGQSLGPLIGNIVLSYLRKHSNQTGGTNEVGDVPYEKQFVVLQCELTLMFIALLLALFFLPESRSHKARRRSIELSYCRSGAMSANHHINWKGTLEKFNIVEPLRLLSYPRELAKDTSEDLFRVRKKVVLYMFIILCFSAESIMGLNNIYILYGAYKFRWTSIELGTFVSVVSFSRAISLLALFPLFFTYFLQKVLGLKVKKHRYDILDFITCYSSIFIEAIFIMGCAFATNIIQYDTLIALSAPGAFLDPVLSSSLVKYYPESKTGEVFSAISLIKNLLNLVGPTLFLCLYNVSLSYLKFPGFPFVVSGCILFSAIFFLPSMWISLHEESKYDRDDIDDDDNECVYENVLNHDAITEVISH